MAIKLARIPDLAQTASPGISRARALVAKAMSSNRRVLLRTLMLGGAMADRPSAREEAANKPRGDGAQLLKFRCGESQ